MQLPSLAIVKDLWYKVTHLGQTYVFTAESWARTNSMTRKERIAELAKLQIELARDMGFLKQVEEASLQGALVLAFFGML